MNPPIMSALGQSAMSVVSHQKTAGIVVTSGVPSATLTGGSPLN